MMLSEWIDLYVKARANGDKKEQERIEKALSKVGMDKITLMAIIKDMEGKENA